MKMNNLENKIMIMLWWIIFTLVLPWDQEKIVVVNLVVFCYFLHYMISSNLESTFKARRQVIKDILVKEINTKLGIINKIVSELKVFLPFYKNIVLSVINSIRVLPTTLQPNKTFTRTLYFKIIGSSLDKISKTTSIEELNKNILASQVLLYTIKPTVKE